MSSFQDFFLGGGAPYLGNLGCLVPDYDNGRTEIQHRSLTEAITSTWHIALPTTRHRHEPFPESVVKGLTAEVAVASYNSNSLNIMVLISSYFLS